MNNRKKAKLRLEAFRANVEKKRAKFRADSKRLGRCPLRGSHSWKNGVGPGRDWYGKWGRMTRRYNVPGLSYLGNVQSLVLHGDFESGPITLGPGVLYVRAPDGAVEQVRLLGGTY